MTKTSGSKRPALTSPMCKAAILFIKFHVDICSSLLPVIVHLHNPGISIAAHSFTQRGACLAVKSVKHTSSSTYNHTASNAVLGASIIVFVIYSVDISITFCSL